MKTLRFFLCRVLRPFSLTHVDLSNQQIVLVSVINDEFDIWYIDANNNVCCTGYDTHKCIEDLRSIRDKNGRVKYIPELDFSGLTTYHIRDYMLAN